MLSKQHLCVTVYAGLPVGMQAKTNLRIINLNALTNGYSL